MIMIDLWNIIKEILVFRIVAYIILGGKFGGMLVY